MKTSACKRQVLQSLACVFQCNAILFKWKLANLPTCPLCGDANQSLFSAAALPSSMQGYWHTTTWQPSSGPIVMGDHQIHCEVSVASLSSVDLEQPLDCSGTLQRMCDELAE